MHFYMHSYLHKIFILVKSGCYIFTWNRGGQGEGKLDVVLWPGRLGGEGNEKGGVRLGVYARGGSR
jgi:hypothetical protein